MRNIAHNSWTVRVSASPPDRAASPPLHPSNFTAFLNALGRRRDLFSVPLMHHFNGALILFSAPEGLLRSVMCASVVCSLPITCQICYLQSAPKMHFARKKVDVTPQLTLMLCSGCMQFAASITTVLSHCGSELTFHSNPAVVVQFIVKWP